MADPLFPNPSDAAGPASPAEWIIRQQRSAQSAALMGLDENPDEGARAIELGNATGEDPALIHGDLDHFEQQHKAALTSQLLSNNQFLRDYANSNSMAPIVSSDDWGQLDRVSEATQKLIVKPPSGLISAPEDMITAAVQAFAEPFKRGFGDGVINRPQDQEFAKNHPYIYSTLANLALTADIPIELFNRTIEGVMAGGGAALEVGAQALGASPETARDIKEGTLATADTLMQMGMTGEIPHAPEVGEGAVQKAAQATQDRQLQELVAAVRPYLEEGKVPPVGVHPIVDKLYAERAKLDMGNLDDIVKEASSSSTRERAPDLFRDFIAQHTDSHIGISADAVRKLYGDKVPEGGDNLLGWVPRIQEQLDLAEAHGGDIQVPLADWVAKVDPEVAKELHDSIRVRPGGMTLEEAKAPETTPTLKPQEEEPIVQDRGNGSYFVRSSQNPNDDLLTLKVEEDAIHAGIATVNEERRGQGIGISLYERALELAGEHGLPLKSDMSVSADAIRVYQGLERRGYEVKEAPNTTTSAKGKTNATAGYVYEVTPKPKPGPVETIRSAAGLSPDPIPAPGPTEDIRGRRLKRSIIPTTATLQRFDLPDGKVVHAAMFNAIDAVREIDPKQLDGALAQAAALMQAAADRIAGDTSVAIVDGPTMESIAKHLDMGPGQIAFYYGKYHAIVMRDDVANHKYGPQHTASVIMEETLHAGTVREMALNPALRRTVSLLRKEAMEWLDANDPKAKKDHYYALQNNDEFIAWALNPYANPFVKGPGFQEVLAKIPVSRQLSESIGVKVNSLWQALREVYRGVMQKWTGKRINDNILDAILRLGPEFDKKNDEIRKTQYEASDTGEMHIPGVTDTLKPQSTSIPFDRPTALGMNKQRAERYRKLIEKQQAEDAEFQRKRGEEVERKRQTKEWKENQSRIRGEVTEDLKNRPDIAADHFMRTGTLFGKRGKKVRLNRVDLFDAEARGLPSDYIADDGVHPDAVGNLFGYPTGRAMIAALMRLHAERGAMSPQAHFNKLAAFETEREMKRTYGNLEENIIEEAKEHVLSPTQLDILHEEMVALGEKAGGPLGEKISKDDIKAWVKTEFDKQPLSAHDSDKYLAASGRAGQAAEDALLADKATDAYKAKQRQIIAIHLAALAKKLEKEQASYEKIAKRYSKREVSGIPPEYTNWIHDILMRTGGTVRRSIQDLQDAIGRETHDSLQGFVDDHNHDARIWEDDPDAPSDFEIMPVAKFLFNPAYRRKIEDMTPPEFRAVMNSIKTLIKNGQDEKKVTVLGEKMDLAETITGMVTQLEELFKGKERQYAFGQKDQGILHYVRTAWASLLQIESIFNRFDKGDPKGIFRKVITQPIFEGSHDLNTLETKYSREYRALDFKKADLNRAVNNPLFGDPLRNGEKAPMTRENLLAVLQNVGNPSQMDKLARGYMTVGEDGTLAKEDVAAFKDQIMQWLFANTKKEDWDRAQAMGDIFEKAFEEAAVMYHGLSGVAPEKIDIRPIQTPFGEYRGWYHPVIYDPLRPGTSKKLMGPDPLDDGSYYRAATPSGYTKRRTGYAAPIQLNFSAIPAKLRAILNDIAMRPAVTEVSKVFYDRGFQSAVTKYYGKEIRDLFIPYLKDVAGMKQYKDAAQSTALRVLEAARQNITATLIGLNPSTVMKHGPTAAMLSIKEVGAGPFLQELKSLLSYNDDLGEKNWSFAMNGGIVDGEPWGGSEELQRRHRNWQETLTGAQADVFGENTLRNTVIKLGATPVAISDLLSAVPTWLAAYKDQIRQGESHGDAVAFADTAVRRAHGSSAVAARPRIMRGGPLAQMATPFYTFFNEMFQRQYEMAWRAKDALGQFNEGDYKAGLKEVPNLMKGLWAFVVFPALIEQAVSPLVTGQESTGEKVLTYGARTLASGIPVLRDMVEAFLGGRDPTVGLYSTGTKMLIDALKDASAPGKAFSKQNGGKTILHAVTAFGAATGLTNAQEGRTGQYIFDVATGKEHPKDTATLLRGLWHGTTKEPRR